ncbi:heterokaryon incompatibility protein-domain-containing protein [Xylariales sp. AK1849]|nr:heterokaryon incompatibility protein-domain-containing protein [Xylariales sp. AK1849]
MRLLHAKTLRFKEHIGNNVPRYIILSHTWGDEGVSFQDFHILEECWDLDPTYRIMAKAGFQKIRDFANMVLHDSVHNVEYIWVDTCCIDKCSSAELQEAINSMFRWYKRAATCYVYLSDVKPGDEIELQTSMFRSSRWFRRGWTLQELLAPDEVIFFNQAWILVGNKRYLSWVIEEITGIQSLFISRRFLSLLTPGPTIAQRMSWMANRETTREEDMAYCLLGIFDISMPLLYGEGERAFTRLQEEIMKPSFLQRWPHNASRLLMSSVQSMRHFQPRVCAEARS